MVLKLNKGPWLVTNNKDITSTTVYTQIVPTFQYMSLSIILTITDHYLFKFKLPNTQNHFQGLHRSR